MLKYDEISISDWGRIKEKMKNELSVDFVDEFKGDICFKNINIAYEYDKKDCSLKISLPWYVPDSTVDKAIKDELKKIKGV